MGDDQNAQGVADIKIQGCRKNIKWVMEIFRRQCDFYDADNVQTENCVFIGALGLSVRLIFFFLFGSPSRWAILFYSLPSLILAPGNVPESKGGQCDINHI